MGLSAMMAWSRGIANLDNMSRNDHFDSMYEEAELKAKNKKRAEKRYNPSVVSKMFGAEALKPGDIFKKKIGKLSEDDRWLLEYELQGIKTALGSRLEPKYNYSQISNIIKIYENDPETASKIKDYLKSDELSPLELLKIYKNDSKLFRLMQKLGIIQGDFNEMFSLEKLNLKYLNLNYAKDKNPVIIQRLDEIATESPDKSRIIDSLISDDKFNKIITKQKDAFYIPISNSTTDDKPEIVDKFVEFYAKDKEFIKKLLTCTNSNYCSKIECDLHSKDRKGKILEYLVNMLEQFEQLEKKGIDKNQLIDGEMKPFTENLVASKNKQLENIDTLEYLKEKNI